MVGEGSVCELLDELVASVAANPAIAAKRSIGMVSDAIGPSGFLQGPGDDGAAVRVGGTNAIICGEALWPPFVKADPRGAGIAAILANVNDVAAMGAIPDAIIDTIVGFVQGLIDIVQGAIDKLVELKNMAIGGASDELISKIKTQTGQSHSGGITSFGASREGLMLLRNNEAVVPLDSPSDANRVLDQAGIGSDPAAFASVVGPMIARAIRQELRAA